MIAEVKQILSMDVSEVISSEHSITLLNIYSILYLHGAQPRYCASSQRAYYQQLKQNGLILAIKYDTKMETKTFVTKFNGIRFIPGVDHIAMNQLTEEKAIAYLKAGYLKESDFIKLPEGYGKAEKKAVQNKEAVVEAIPINAPSEEIPARDLFVAPKDDIATKRPYNRKKK